MTPPTPAPDAGTEEEAAVVTEETIEDLLDEMRLGFKATGRLARRVERNENRLRDLDQRLRLLEARPQDGPGDVESR